MRQNGEARIQKSKKIGHLRPEGRPSAILGRGLAECAGRAEALELVKTLTVRSARLDPRNGGGGLNRSAHSAGPKEGYFGNVGETGKTYNVPGRVLFVFSGTFQFWGTW